MRLPWAAGLYEHASIKFGALVACRFSIMGHRFFLFLVFFSYLNSSFGQKHDNTWHIGYTGNGEQYGISKITFTEGSFNIKKDTSFTHILFDSNNTNFSDSFGNYIALFDGFRIYDKTGKKMLHGDSIWFDTLPYLYGYSDDDLTQGGMFLPWPGHPDSILLFYTSQGNAAWPDWSDLACLNLFYSIIQLSGNSGKGDVVVKRNEIIADTIQYGRLTAAKHANGRDWWVLINERNTNRFYSLLLDPGGIKIVGSQQVDLPIIDGVGQAVFSPNGYYYAIKNSVGTTVGNALDIFRFDRCSGTLSKQYQIRKDSSSLGGAAFSPNSRYLYVSNRTELYQYDMDAADLDSSKILVGVYEPPASGFPATFFTMQLAPDNKIYMCATNSIKYLHVIHSPDERGLNCNFQQRGVEIPTKNYSSVSFSPYYRLGPLDNSPCDTLGIDNNPKAWFRYDHDTLDILDVSFHDLSYYEPTTWLWNFGDGSTLNHEQHPVHQFGSVGLYQVCLTVKNVNNTDTYCKDIHVGISATENPDTQSQVAVWPIPFNERLIVNCSLRHENYFFRLYDQLGGLKVFKSPIASGTTEIDVQNLMPGFYYWEFRSRDNKFVESGKTLKLSH